MYRNHNFNYEDIIILEYKNIKEYKLKENRFNPYSITIKDKQKMYNKYLIFKSIYNREPNLEEIDKYSIEIIKKYYIFFLFKHIFIIYNKPL